MSQMLGDRYVVRGSHRRSPVGVWHVVSHVDGQWRGALRLTPLDAGAAQRLRHTVWAVGSLQLTGILPVVDQVADDSAHWLITSVPAAPTLAQALATGVTLQPQAALLIAVETGQTLDGLHRTNNAHGRVSAENVVLGAAGVVMLAECGYEAAANGQTPYAGDDVAAWAELLRQLAGLRPADATRAALLQTADAAAGAGLPTALSMLIGFAQQLPGFGERAPIAALAASVPPTALEEQTTLDLPGPLSIRHDDQQTQMGQRAQQLPAPAEAGVNMRFGRGVPPVWQPAPTASYPQLAAKKRKRLFSKIASGVLTVAIVGLVAAYFLWPSAPLALKSATINPVPIRDGQCEVKVKITALIHTNGERGTIKYHWIRNDDKDSGPLETTAPSGESTVEVALFWDFTGKGVYNAEVTLEVLEPTPLKATSEFTYRCG